MKWAMVLGLLLVVACSGEGDQPAFKQVAVEDLGPLDVERFESARGAVQTLGASLMAALLEAMTRDGPVEAISACRELAPRLTAEVSEKSGVRFGRTSHRLRNRENGPPPWAADLQAAQPRIYLGPDGEMGVTLPIVMKKMCLACHGPAADLDPALVAKLAELYPDDQAKGFAEGEIRGQFWVEY